MRIGVVAVGTRMPSWVEEGVAEYRKRIPTELGFSIREVPLARRSKNQPVERAVETEGEAILAATSADDRVIALDITGKAISTEYLARSLESWQLEGVNVSLLVGGPDGLSSACLRRADARWSLSAMTLPHPVVRVLLTEQLYRAWTILHNHPYHR